MARGAVTCIQVVIDGRTRKLKWCAGATADGLARSVRTLAFNRSWSEDFRRYPPPNHGIQPRRVDSACQLGRISVSPRSGVRVHGRKRRFTPRLERWVHRQERAPRWVSDPGTELSPQVATWQPRDAHALRWQVSEPARPLDGQQRPTGTPCQRVLGLESRHAADQMGEQNARPRFGRGPAARELASPEPA